MLLYRLLLLLLTKGIHLVRPWIICVLRLEKLLLGLLHLLPACLLRLLISEAILECSLLWLHASRLAVCIVQIPSLLWLLNGITKPVHCSLLLIALVKASWLWRLAGSVIKQQIFLLRVCQLPLPQLFLFFAELQCLGQIVISLHRSPFPSPRSIFLCLVSRGLKREFVFQVVVVVRSSLALLSSLLLSRFASKPEVLKTGNA